MTMHNIENFDSYINVRFYSPHFDPDYTTSGLDVAELKRVTLNLFLKLQLNQTTFFKAYTLYKISKEFVVGLLAVQCNFK